MSLNEVRQAMLADCQIVCNGIVYARIVAYEVSYDRGKHKWLLSLILQDNRSRNSVTRVSAEKCKMIPL